MNNTGYFITEKYIKDNSPITENVDPKDIFPHVSAAQHIYLRVILGDTFYDYLLSAYIAQTLNADEIILVQNYIQPSVLYRSLQMALPFCHFNWRNKGLITNTDDAGNAADFSSFKFILNEIIQRASLNDDQLKKYLLKESSLFPEYHNQTGLTQPCSTDIDYSMGLIFYRT